jgi:hypothetical protein
MTNDDKVKLANEILAINDAYYVSGTIHMDTPTLKAIVSEWLQFTQFSGESIGKCEHGSPRNLCEHCYWATVLKEVDDAKINQK